LTSASISAAADLLERLRDVDLRDAALALEYFERPFEFVG